MIRCNYAAHRADAALNAWKDARNAWLALTVAGVATLEMSDAEVSQAELRARFAVDKAREAWHRAGNTLVAKGMRGEVRAHCGRR